MIETLTAPSRFDQFEAQVAKLEPRDAPITNHWAPGLYGREMLIREGTMLTGKKHKQPCLNVVHGDITVYNVEDDKQERITGFKIFMSPAGTRRAGFAHADTTWITFHPTESTNLAEIEEQVIEKYENPLLRQGAHQIES